MISGVYLFSRLDKLNRAEAPEISPILTSKCDFTEHYVWRKRDIGHIYVYNKSQVSCDMFVYIVYYLLTEKNVYLNQLFTSRAHLVRQKKSVETFQIYVNKFMYLYSPNQNDEGKQENMKRMNE